MGGFGGHLCSLQDAVVAITIMDVSMNNSSILGHGNNMTSSFDHDPDASGFALENRILRILTPVDPLPSHGAF